MYILGGKNKMAVLVVMLSLIVETCVGSGVSTARETVRIDKKTASIGKSKVL